MESQPNQTRNTNESHQHISNNIRKPNVLSTNNHPTIMEN